MPQAAARVAKRAWLVLVMLIIVYVLNYLCRFLPAVLAKPIQETLHITDGQFGLITGFYFALFYTLISLPIGFLADKTSRSKVLACGCAIWSAATAACGYATNFMQFAFSYMAVGFGEAGGVPPSYALISDYFPPGKRGTALGLFNLGMPIGAALAIGFGAAITAAFGWETAFKGLGAIGLLAVIGILVVVKEPRRGGLDPVSAPQLKKSGFWETLISFFSRRSLVVAALAGGITQIMTAGVGAFAILFMMREKGMTLNEVAVWYALMVLITMSLGLFVAGRSVDMFTRRSKRAYGLTPAISLTISLPFYVAFVGTPTWPEALAFLAGCMFLNFFYLPSVITLVQQEVRPDQRALSGALMLATMNLIGIGLGPTIIGAASDYFRTISPEHSLQYAFFAVLPCTVTAIMLFFWLSRMLGRDGKAGSSSTRTPPSSSAKLAAVRSDLQGFVDRGELAGIVTLVSRHGEIVSTETLGWSNMEARVPMQPDTLFRIASMSKPITSVAALMLVEEGKLALDAPISRWVPELAARRVLKDPAGPLGDTVAARREITIEDLLTHRSGIAYGFLCEEPLKSAYDEAIGDPSMNRLSVDEWLAGLGTLPLAYQPGERFQYGHSTDVLGFLIGRVEGKPFRDVLRERVFAPLGMADTDFWLPKTKRNRLATIYSYDADADRLNSVELPMYDDPPAYASGGGGLISSAPEYHRFVRLLLNDGESGGVRLLKPETVRMMRTNRLTPEQRKVPFLGMPLWQKNGFGLGVALVEDPVDNIYSSGRVGSMTWPGIFGTWWQADPVEDIIMIYLIQHRVPVTANSGATIATGRGAAGRRALPLFQHGVYGALTGSN